MIILINFLPNTSGLVYAKNLRKWAEKAFAFSTVVFHDPSLLLLLVLSIKEKCKTTYWPLKHSALDFEFPVSRQPDVVSGHFESSTRVRAFC
jgi:hypothetical protein